MEVPSSLMIQVAANLVSVLASKIQFLSKAVDQVGLSRDPSYSHVWYAIFILREYGSGSGNEDEEYYRIHLFNNPRIFADLGRYPFVLIPRILTLGTWNERGYVGWYGLSESTTGRPKPGKDRKIRTKTSLGQEKDQKKPWWKPW